MELSQLRTLREVAETLNFTRAAERLGLTQSAVSHQIKSLEVELGEPLFVRAKRGVLLSEGGRAALEHSIRILDEVEALRVRLPGAEGTPSGRVRAAAATQAFVQQCKAAGRPGKIVNISSVHEELAFPNFAAYCASKGGVRMLTRTLAVELGPLGITINSIAPGAIETPINTKLLNDPIKLQSLVRQIPLSRLGKPNDVAGLAVFLASRDSDYVTGTTYLVDGGLTVFYQEQ